MQIKSDVTERVLKSFGFSVALFVIWGGLTVPRALALWEQFEPIECVFVAYNATIAILFLIRSRPSTVSMNPVHWVVALVTSFSGLFFLKREVACSPLWSTMSDGLILFGLVVSGVAAVALGRSYDFLPALRSVATKWMYQVVRHPMYVASILIRMGYLIRHFSAYNLVVFTVMVWLYDKRAKYEEGILQHDPGYRAYTERVRFMFVPMIY